MEANELRIGNLVYSNTGQGGWDTVHKFNEKDFGITLAGTPLYKSFTPIPLTEEWKDKLGFRYCTFNKWLGGYKMDVFYKNWKCEFFIIKKPDYVHELQNLWKALTSNELTINL